MNTKKLYIFLPFVLLLTIVACQREDDEPRKAKKPISRLYVSTSEYSPNSAEAAFSNVFVIDPADSTDVFTSSNALRFESGAKGANAIHFSAFARCVFLGSVNTSSYVDTTIQVLSVNEKGQLATTGTIRNRKFNRVRGLWYHNIDNLDQLLVTNLGNDTVSVFVIDKPKNKNGYTKAVHQIMLEDRVWGIQLDSTNLILSKTGVDGGILVFKNFVNKVDRKVDTLVKDIQPDYRLRIVGSKNIRGFFYAKESDVLVLSDYEDVGVGARVLIFENFSQYKSSGDITPTRVIAGAATLLKEPLSVMVDGKETPRYIYVSDATARRVFRFLLSDNGNVAPNGELSVGSNQTPQAIFLDSRGVGRID